MDLADQIRVWNEEGAFGKVIKAVETRGMRGTEPDLVSEAARAYLNRANGTERTDILRAYVLLRGVEPALAEDHHWNHRMGVACAGVGRDAQALHYLERACALMPDDAASAALAEQCRERLSLPLFARPFAARADDFWDQVSRQADELRALADGTPAAQAGAGQRVSALLFAAGITASEVGVSCAAGGVQVTFAADGPAQALAYRALADRMPHALADRWVVTVDPAAADGPELP